MNPSSLVFVPSHKESLEVMFYDRTKDIPVYPVSMHEFEQRISPVVVFLATDSCSMTKL